MTQKYEFKDIKDVDISKLEDDKIYHLIGNTNLNTSVRGSYLKLNSDDFLSILLPCPPIVETDKLREEFESQFSTMYSKNKRGVNPYVSWEGVFNFFLPHLSVSKEVESTDTDFCMAMAESSLEKVWSKEVEVSDEEIEDFAHLGGGSGFYSKGFIEGAKWMRDKQGIAPKEVEEKGCYCYDIMTVDYNIKQCVKCKKFFDLNDL